MLFIHDDDAQTMKDNGVLNQCMGTDSNVNPSIGQAGQDISSTFGGHTARQ